MSHTNHPCLISLTSTIALQLIDSQKYETKRVSYQFNTEHVSLCLITEQKSPARLSFRNDFGNVACVDATALSDQ